MSNVYDTYCYFKLLNKVKKTWRQRGAYTRCCKAGNLKKYFERYGEFHFPSDLPLNP